MTTPKDSRPFDLVAAKAGHPIVTRDGRVARFIAHVPDAIASNRLIMLIPFEKGGCTYSYHENGFWRGIENNNDCVDLFLAPLGYCEGRAVFHGDKLFDAMGEEFIAPLNDSYMAKYERCSWPKPAHVVETRMDYDDYYKYYHDVAIKEHRGNWGNTERFSWSSNACQNLANAAIARSIADGDVIPVSLLNSLANDCVVFLPTSERDFRKGLKYFLKEYLEGLKK